MESQSENGGRQPSWVRKFFVNEEMERQVAMLPDQQIVGRCKAGNSKQQH